MTKSILTAYLIALLTAAVSCKPVVEPRAYGEYFVTNSTGKAILLSATGVGGFEPTFLVNPIPVGEKAHIYSFESSGHVRPSNAFSAFTVYSESKDPANIIYSKVEDADWLEEGVDANGHFIYHLTIN